ncbi:unnamed protein product [Lactuca virosa]|uniref:Ubiquitin receptor RAD23 n=1 Tax=Lactuca virosa TaxID=75947 RepID=A0AAU9LH43_9ASTR|nr:unnamed protein product [Lactuca virosa]
MGGGCGGDGSDGGGAVTAVTINVSCTDGTKFTVQVSLDSSVQSFKSLLAKTCDIPAEEQRLIYKGGILKDDQTLKSYGLEAEHTVHLVRRVLPDASDNTAEEGTRGGSGGLPAYAIDLSGFPEFEQMQHEFIQNPDMIVETIHQPFAQIMMSYPDVMRNILLSDPISRQVIDRDPDLASILYDPSIFSQMTEIVRHTSVEFIRNLIRIAEGAGGGDGGSSDGGDGGSSGGATQTHPAVIDLSNPAVSHNVQDMNQMSGVNANANPIAEMRNPQMNSEENMEQSLFSQLGQQQSTRMGVSQTSGGTVGPEEVYASEVAELEEMGFPDTRRNIEALALAATEGNIPDAVDRLLGGQ